MQEGRRATCHTHFDERGLGFFALGLAKSTHSPVAVIVTSGTAAANLYPSIVEAHQSAVNLIILTADRPDELIECGANQAILQKDMFGDYPLAAVNLPRPSPEYPVNWLISTLDHACHQQQKQNGVVHLNVPFAEPLYEADEAEIDTHPWLSSVQRWLSQHKYWADHQAPQLEVLMHEHWDNWRTKRGVIVVGKLPLEQAMGIHAWAATMGWILLTDIQSTVKPSLPYADI